jgi:hypothetical protein
VNPEQSPDRLKMRLIVRGDTEPRHLFEGVATDSPTPMASSMRLMIALEDEEYDSDDGECEELALGDVGTAFLKGDEYSTDEPVRWVAYKAHKNARLRVFKLKGSLYGQVDAPIRWFNTVVDWMVKEQGFVQSKNDVCLFRHPKTRLKVLMHVDDNLSRGKRRHSTKFWQEMHERFGLKYWAFLETGEQRKFIGCQLFKDAVGGKHCFGLHQNEDVAAFVDEHMPSGSLPVKSPMTNKHEMYVDSTLLS